MNKKNITLILIISLLLSVLVMGIFGTPPKEPDKIPAETLVFYNETGEVITKNDEGILTINLDPINDIIVYKFSVEVLPANTTDTDIVIKKIIDGTSEITELEAPETEPLNSNENEEEEKIPFRHYYQVVFGVDSQFLSQYQFCFNQKEVELSEKLQFTFIEHQSEDVDI